jgi:hypothetical protein
MPAGGISEMMAYEFYWRDEVGEIHLIGILPERRKDPKRITNESILNWVDKVTGHGVNNIFFTKVSIEDS